MRQVISLSLQPDTIKVIKQKTKSRGFDSVSSYVNYLVQADDDLISEEELLAEIKQAEKEEKEGKLLQADSVVDLLEKYGNK